MHVFMNDDIYLHTLKLPRSCSSVSSQLVCVQRLILRPKPWMRAVLVPVRRPGVRLPVISVPFGSWVKWSTRLLGALARRSGQDAIEKLAHPNSLFRNRQDLTLFR